VRITAGSKATTFVRSRISTLIIVMGRPGGGAVRLLPPLAAVTIISEFVKQKSVAKIHDSIPRFCVRVAGGVKRPPRALHGLRRGKHLQMTNSGCAVPQ
jgi:hypothetical protein